MKANNISRILFLGVCVVLFLPVIIIPPYFQPSDWTRSILFRIILTVLVSFLLFKLFYKKDISLSLPKWKNSIYLPLLILASFFITLILATIFSEDIRFSVFGSPSRAGGILNLIFYFIFSIILALFINKNQWEKLFNVLFITGFLSALLAIIQYFNILKNVFIAYEGGSTPSFLGNSTVLAMYMLFLSFLSFVFFIQKQKKKEKLLYGSLFFLFVFTILITGSRAGYLGLLVGFLYFSLFYPIKNRACANMPEELSEQAILNKIYHPKLKTLKIIAVFILLFSITAIALFNFFPQLGEKNNILKIITNRVSVKTIAKDIAGTRLSAWKMTLEAIKDKPLLGWGPENFYIGFEKYYDSTPFTTSILLWDRPHNIILDIAVNSGIFSLLLYVSFWIALFWQLQIVKNYWQDYRQKNVHHSDVQHLKTPDVGRLDDQLMAHGVQAMFIGYLVVLFFNFDSFATYLISFFFVGYALYLISLHIEKIEILPNIKTMTLKKSAVVVFLPLIILFLWFWNIKPLYLNEKITHAKNLSRERRCKEAFNVSNNKNWEKSGILKSYAILLYSDIVKNCAFIEPEKEVEYSKKMVSLLKIAADAQPKFSRTWLFMGSFANVLAARESTSAQGSGGTKENPDNKNTLLLEARGYLKKALELSPKRQEIFAELGKNYLIAQDYEAMKNVGQDCIAIDPRYGECYWHLGLAQIFLSEQEEGKKNIDLALKNGYNYNPAYKQLAVAYMSQKNWKDAVAAYEKFRKPDEKSAAASYSAALAFLYDKAGDYQKAGEAALEVFKLQPENPETVPFIKSLLGKKPNDQILNSSLAFIYSQPGKEQELSKARAIYLQLVSDYPKNTDYLWELTKIHYQLKEYDKAYQGALFLVELNPSLNEQMENFIKTMPQNYWEYYVKTHPY